ncbi:BTAD domain-containing putative transcriptional regulator [Jidongwangia harbinensis]|uniref:BTAD domain-containing putative transcriptional regulator n=1 Tax=Jidongwangia harbinensis TaxID=2878561 RepID=UPI001CD9F8C0|nr:AfsR/SARP family transcriptional regulator [Jidongwangia harbinensis]MCA2213972.1 AAA family ATPase [Jidongwangia harbinensis]
MQVRLLGTVDVLVGGEHRPVPGLRRKAILSVLALNAGRTVSAERLIDLVWGDRADRTGRNTVQSHVSYLRQRLGARSAIVARPPGYLLDVPGDATDAAAAERLIRSGLHTADPARQAGALRAALDLWRGQALQDVRDVPWLADQARRLSTLELEARRALADARLRLGEHTQLLPELRLLAEQHPFDEQVQAQLVLALYRTGRQSDALAILRGVRQRLAADLGIDPGPAVQDLEAAVLRQDPSLAAPGGPVVLRAAEGAGSPAADPFVGRAAELTALLDRLEPGGGRSPTVVAVGGDPGIGKTRLLSEFAAAAERRGRTVLRGRATEFEQQVPFAVVVDALADHVAGLDPDLLGDLGPEDLGLLAEILPVPGPGPTAASRRSLAAERFRLHRAVRALLGTLTRRSGLVLILEDLHWADHGSAELLGHLLRHPVPGALLLAASYRPRQLPGLLRQHLGRAVQDGTAETVTLGPLPPDEAARLLPAGYDADRRRQLYAASGGNPLYLQALVRTGGTGGGDHGGPGGTAGDAVPGAVRDALAAEVEALGANDLLVARAAAVSAGLVEPGLVAETAGLPADEVSRALDTLVARDLLRPVPRAHLFQFRHPLVRRVTYDTAGSGWRAAAHARTAAALARRGAAATEQAPHVERSAQRGDHAAVALLSAAASDTLHSNPAVAAHWLGAALRLVPHDAAPAARLDLLRLRAQALALSGQLAESRTALHELLHLLPADVTPVRADLVSACAGVERMLGRHREADAMLRAELARPADPHGRAAATLTVAMASKHLQPARPGDPDWPREALAAARRAGTRGMVADALVQCVLTDQITGGWGPGTARLAAEAAAIVDAMPDGELHERLHTAVWLATAESAYERLPDATRHLTRAHQLARDTGQMYVVHGIHLLFAGLHQMYGDLAQSARSLDDARDAIGLAGTLPFLVLVLSRQSTCAGLRGDLDLARRLAREAVTLSPGGRDYLTGAAVEALAFVHLHTGDPAACADLLRDPGTFIAGPHNRSTRYEMLALAAAELGAVADASAWADRAEAEVAGWPTPRRAALAALARSHALRPVDAAAAADRSAVAAAGFAAAGDLLLAARAHLHTSTALAARDPRAAAEERACAGQLFRRCGAELFLDRVRDGR